MSEILPDLFLGDSFDASNIDFLRSKKIVTIINCTNDLPFYFKTARDPYKFQYIRCPVNDDLTKKSTKIMSKILPQMVELIDQNLELKVPILIHCLQGRQRSATLVAAYLCYSNRCRNVDEAIAFIKKKRMVAFCPSANFYREMLTYVENQDHL